MDEKIEWSYFFGGKCGKRFDRYYASEINGIRIEKLENNQGIKYSIGNMDLAKKKYKTKSELIEAVTNNSNT